MSCVLPPALAVVGAVREQDRIGLESLLVNAEGSYRS